MLIAIVIEYTLWHPLLIAFWSDYVQIVSLAVYDGNEIEIFASMTKQAKEAVTRLLKWSARSSGRNNPIACLTFRISMSFQRRCTRPLRSFLLLFDSRFGQCRLIHLRLEFAVQTRSSRTVAREGRNRCFGRKSFDYLLIHEASLLQFFRTNEWRSTEKSEQERLSSELFSSVSLLLMEEKKNEFSSIDSNVNLEAIQR